MIKIDEINKPTLKVSVSDSEESSAKDSEVSEDEVEQEAGQADVESDGSEESSPEDTLMMNEGWADSISKILVSKKPKNKKTLVLSRAKKHTETVKVEKEQKPEFEVIGKTVEVKKEIKEDKDACEPVAKKKKVEKASIKVKPNVLEKDREKLLSKIATKGVVQLFNAVRNQQKSINQIDKSHMTEGKKEKVLKKFDKRTFLDTLMGGTKSIVVDDVQAAKKEVKEEAKPKWSALRDDFMTGAKMKDWDKESVDE